MKVYKIEGELIVEDEMTHEEVVRVLFEVLKRKGIHFRGITKQK